MAPDSGPDRTVVGRGSPVYTVRGPRHVTSFGSSPPDVGPGIPGITYPVEVTTADTEVKATCSAEVLKSADVPASAGGVTPGEFFANSADLVVFSTSVISTEVLPVAGTPGTLRGPALMSGATVPRRDPERAVDEISPLVGFLARHEGDKVTGVPAVGRGAEGGPVLDASIGVYSPSKLLPPTVTRDVAVVAVTEVSSEVDALVAVRTGFYYHDPVSSGTLCVVIIRLVTDVPPEGVRSVLPRPGL